MAVAVAGALGAGLLPESVLPYLGLSPLALGLRAAWRLWRERHDQDHDGMTERVGPGALSVAAVTFANGGDNIGVYVPGFTQIQSRRTRYLRRRVPGPCRRLVRGRTLARHPADRRPCASAVGPPAAARGTDWPRSGHPHPRRRLRHRSSRMSRRGRSAPGWRPFRPRRASNFGCQRRIAVMRVARAFIGQVHRAVIGMTGRPDPSTAAGRRARTT